MIHYFLTRVIGSLFIASLAQFAMASSPVLDTELTQLKHGFQGDTLQVRGAIDRLEWSGISNPELFDPIAERLKNNYTNPSADAMELNSWLVKALSLSGQEKYQSLFDTILTDKKLKKLHKYTEIAVKRLQQFHQWNPVIASDNETAISQDALNRMRTLNMLKAKDFELSSAGARRILNSYTHDKEMVGAVNDILLANYSTANNSEQLDALAWMCRAVGESHLTEFKPTLEKIASDSKANRKLKKYAKKYNWTP